MAPAPKADYVINITPPDGADTKTLKATDRSDKEGNFIAIISDGAGKLAKHNSGFNPEKLNDTDEITLQLGGVYLANTVPLKELNAAEGNIALMSYINKVLQDPRKAPKFKEYIESKEYKESLPPPLDEDSNLNLIPKPKSKPSVNPVNNAATLTINDVSAPSGIPGGTGAKHLG